MSTPEKIYLKNWKTVSNHGNVALRQKAIDLIEHGLRAADPYLATKRMVHLEKNTLRVNKLCLDLSLYNRIIVLGAGKATYPIVKALEEILGDRITDGLVVLKSGSLGDLNHVKVIYASHPIPDEDGYRGAQLMYDMAQQYGEKDLVIAAITGGSSALLPLPVEGVSLSDKKKVNEILLFSGADITQINAVRKHLSRIKGGLLAKALFPATVVNLTVSDVNGDPLDYITCPTVPDTSTFDDARLVMDEYNFWDSFPPAAADYLRNGGLVQETPKEEDFIGAPLHTYITVDSTAACVAVAKRAKEIGYKPMILTTMLKGEAKDAGMLFASIGMEIARFRRPLVPPCVVIAGGENTVTIQKEHGTGGPNQEFALAAAIEIIGMDNILIASIDTDGSDGPNMLAGGMIDGSSMLSARRRNFDMSKSLRMHDVSPILRELGDELFTGPTGTNINDLKMLLVSG